MVFYVTFNLQYKLWVYERFSGTMAADISVYTSDKTQYLFYGLLLGKWCLIKMLIELVDFLSLSLLGEFCKRG